LLGLVLKYSLFAMIATAVNLFTQWPIFRFSEEGWVPYAAMAAGTLTGLATKYLLDKRWTFYYIPANRADNFRRFLLYSLMGVITTGVFWSTEMFFYYHVPFDDSQYLGGALGLAVGYTMKYLLDKRFVFKVST
jgi:putative flippase GtrA